MKKILFICFLLTGISAGAWAQVKSTTDPNEKAKGLQKQLKLTDVQTTKVEAIYKESAEKFEKIKEAKKGNTDKMMADIGPLRKATIKKIKAVLTPRQKAKYDKLINDTHATGGNGWSDGWSSTSSTN